MFRTFLTKIKQRPSLNITMNLIGGFAGGAITTIILSGKKYSFKKTQVYLPDEPSYASKTPNSTRHVGYEIEFYNGDDREVSK